MKHPHFPSASLPPQMLQELSPHLISAIIQALSIVSTGLEGIRLYIYRHTGQKLSPHLLRCWDRCISSTACGCALYSGSQLSEMAKNTAPHDSRIPPDCKQIAKLRHADNPQNHDQDAPETDVSKNVLPNPQPAPFPHASLQNTALGFALSRLLHQKLHLQSMSEDNNNCINCILSHLGHVDTLCHTDIQAETH